MDEGTSKYVMPEDSKARLPMSSTQLGRFNVCNSVHSKKHPSPKLTSGADGGISTVFNFEHL